MWKNTDQKNSEFGQFSRGVISPNCFHEYILYHIGKNFIDLITSLQIIEDLKIKRYVNILPYPLFISPSKNFFEK